MSTIATDPSRNGSPSPEDRERDELTWDHPMTPVAPGYYWTPNVDPQRDLTPRAIDEGNDVGWFGRLIVTTLGVALLAAFIAGLMQIMERY